MISRSIYNLKICPICMCDIPFGKSILQLSNGIRHVMPSTDRKLELTAKASMAQPVSQPAVCSNGLTKFQMAPTPSTLTSSGFKKKEPRYLCLSEARASHSHKICTEVSSSVPHFLQVGSLLSPITCRCLLRVLCPVSRPITALDCVLLKDNNRAPTARD
jgi:hypothetical protein